MTRSTPTGPSLTIRKKVEPGSVAPVYQADFGRLGMAICFDANFPEVWKNLAAQGAKLVVWPSAYSAGTTLQAHALIHHFYIVTSTWTRDCIVYDITGEEMLYQKSRDINVTHVTLDLDRGIYHQNFNLPSGTSCSKNIPKTSTRNAGSIASSGLSSGPTAPE